MKRRKEKDKEAAAELTARFKEEYGEIFLLDANDTFLKYTGLKEDDIGKSIKKLFDKDECKRLRQKFSVYRGVRFDYNYMWQPDSRKKTVFKVHETAEYPFISCRGIKMTENSFASHDFPSRSQTPPEFVMFVRDTDGYSIKMKSESLSLSEPCLSGVRHIGCGSDRLFLILEECASSNQTIRICGRPFPDSGRLYSITFNPLISDGEVCILAELKTSIPETVTYTADCPGAEYLFGTGTVFCPAPGREYLGNVSPFLADMIKNERISCRQITDAYPYKSALAQGLSKCGLIRFPGEPDNAYMMGAIPVLSGTRVTRVTVILIPADNQSLMDEEYLSRLTPREENVIRLCAKGLGCKELSRMLNISEGTVKREIFSSCQKLEVKGKLGIMLKLHHIT